MTLSVLRTEPAGEIPSVAEGPAPSDGGGRGIRTPGTVSRTVVFKTTRFNRSRIPPRLSTTPSLVYLFGSLRQRPDFKLVFQKQQEKCRRITHHIEAQLFCQGRVYISG